LRIEGTQSECINLEKQQRNSQVDNNFGYKSPRVVYQGSDQITIIIIIIIIPVVAENPNQELIQRGM
jgi:hypothetical protein